MINKKILLGDEEIYRHKNMIMGKKSSISLICDRITLT